MHVIVPAASVQLSHASSSTKLVKFRFEGSGIVSVTSESGVSPVFVTVAVMFSVAPGQMFVGQSSTTWMLGAGSPQQSFTVWSSASPSNVKPANPAKQ